MNLENLTKKEKMVLIGGIRLFLWQVYGMSGQLERENEVTIAIKKEFPRPENVKESDIDIVLETAIELYTKLAYLILEDGKE